MNAFVSDHTKEVRWESDGRMTIGRATPLYPSAWIDRELMLDIERHADALPRAVDSPGLAHRVRLAPRVVPLRAGLTKAQLLDKAREAVADRGLNYGKPEDNFNRIALRWKAHIKNRFGLDVPIDGVSVAIMMGDVKVARLENAPGHVDSWVDLAGYAACGAEIATAVQS